jgi:uncharacterized protein involved in exopolysaccharide biosynthesis
MNERRQVAASHEHQMSELRQQMTDFIQKAENERQELQNKHEIEMIKASKSQAKINRLLEDRIRELLEQLETNRMTFEGYLSFMQLAHNQSAKLQALNSEMPSRLRCRLSNHRNRTTLCRDRIAASETVRLGTPDFQL